MRSATTRYLSVLPWCLVPLLPTCCRPANSTLGKTLQERLEAQAADGAFSAEGIAAQLRKHADWDRIVVFAPYRTEKEFMSAGIAQDVANELVEISNGIEAWHAVLLDNKGKVVARVHKNLSEAEHPKAAIVALRR